MTVQDTSLQTRPTKKIQQLHRRAAVRYPSSLQSFDPPTGDRRADLWWEAMVGNLSAAHVTLIVGRRFEIGTVLVVELQNLTQNFSRRLFAQVIGVQAQETGGWAVACKFLIDLSQDELRELH